jgi:alanine racemase
MERLKAWCKLNKKEQAIRCHIGLDTGMNRLGLETSDGNLLKTVEEIYNFITECKENDSITFAGLCTHMAAATTDGPNKDVSVKQSEKFIEVFAAVEAKGLEVECFHIENSVCCMEDLLPDPTIRKRLVEHGDSKKKRATGYVRVGMAAYGYYGGPNEQKFVKPTLHFKAQIRHIQVCEKGESVSYDLTYKAPAKCIMATLSVGYADGYPRCLSNKGQVLVQGNTYTVVGTICMDMMMVSLGPLDGAGKDVAVGDYATLALTSAAGLAVDWDQVGELAGTVSTEVMCQLSSRVTRVYMGK